MGRLCTTYPLHMQAESPAKEEKLEKRTHNNDRHSKNDSLRATCHPELDTMVYRYHLIIGMGLHGPSFLDKKTNYQGLPVLMRSC